MWRKRRWRCPEPACDYKTWTERCEHLDAQVVLTRRAGAEACRQVGELARPVSQVAEEFGVCWWTVMNAVIEHGIPLDHARRVADPFHVERVGNRCLDKVRRRVQQETLGHRGRKHDPLYRIRKLLLTGDERLDDRGRDRMLLGLRVGDPQDEVLGAWLAKESVRDIYLAQSWRDARTLLDKAAKACLADDVPEIVTLGKTLTSWRREILAHHSTGASNGPTEGLNLCVKKVKRCGHGFRTFEHYRLRVLLHAGGITWPQRPRPPRIRTRAPYSVA